ncbi:MAG: ribonuclease P protein component [Deltaproteobacteria bacterium CG_4_8_14_3_um_filter_51_11]|nr:ribonuclease P protein component [bacterium]OIP40187.1 MAG: ribonuclease P protein component [Desulfobacteraceae bacterium CG2_30_51_40]PIP46010.1 MAG: ribonuclease P protein component [Deltaproteobacteria bacterium CG23_combo_of_CG06-09_8_20_14_all_51_20]PIW01343.1 MAG: ribonuclease P protein component [Deltaproteobacteria bacterium CG17_big_fil_post_rev_8_21_14_2_50_51_6]PIX18471.1 MAG: ribonuclease P protein component [Deltaproteobacteria bacterium CG_4_8_14_3_um_filter_51_11]PIY22256.1 
MKSAPRPDRILPSRESYAFPKSLRLLKRAEFVNLKSSRRRFHTDHFILVFKSNELGTQRLGLSVSKRTGSAVRRNRMKRLLRECFRLHRPEFPAGCDTLIIGKRFEPCINLRLVEQEIESIIVSAQ